jgi:tRNA splicing endonuclease
MSSSSFFTSTSTSTSTTTSPPPPTGIVLNGRVTQDGRVYLFSPSEALLLRTKGRIAVTAIGACGAKAATNGKAAAVPVLLSDEELFTCFVSGYFPLGSIKGEWGLETNHQKDTVVIVDAGEILARSLYKELIDCRKRNEENYYQSSIPFSLPIPTLRSALKRLVFLDLWRKGYSCTIGLKFGVDFLCYRGDPSNVHAAFMVMVAEEGEGIALLDLVARSRVATTALKVCVMAWALPEISINDEKEEVELTGGSVRYSAFKRMGPGTAIFSDNEAMKAGVSRHNLLGEEWRENTIV